MICRFLLFCLFSSTIAQQQNFDTIVSFGDSYSDITTGLVDGGSANFYNSKLAQALNVSNFFCYSKAGAIIDARIKPLGRSAPQYQFYANTVAYQMYAFQNDPNISTIAYNTNTLFVLWVGINDLNKGRFSISDWDAQASLVTSYIKTNIDIMDSIYAQNPHFKHHQWVVLNLPTFYNFPSSVYQQTSAEGGETKFNSKLTTLYPSTGNADYTTTYGADLSIVDIYALTVSVVGPPGQWYFTPYGAQLLDSMSPCVSNLGVCVNPSRYQYYITIHQCSTMHQLFANAILASVASSSAISATQLTWKPTARPSSVPTRKPSSIPSVALTRKPTSVPTRKPTGKPSVVPSRKPTSSPTVRPTRQPSVVPTRKPTSSPTVRPTRQPSVVPTRKPTSSPTTRQPSVPPTRKPTYIPTVKPTLTPTVRPC